MKNVLLLIKQRLPEMTTAEKKLAMCILEKPELVINETVTHLAKRAGTSTGSVANFATGMGFSGFSDMKIQIAQNLEKRESLTFDGVYAGDDPRGAMYKIISAAQKSFKDTFEATGQELSDAAQLLMGARRIEVYASGSSLPVAQDVYYRLMRIGLPAVIVPDPLIAGMSAAQLSAEDVVLAVSHKGRTNNTLDPVKIAKGKGVKVITLTSFPQSPLGKLSDVCLVSVSSETEGYREAVISRLAQLMITDSLCAYIAAKRPLETVKFLDDEMEVLEKYRNTERE